MSWLAWTISMNSSLLNNTSFPFYWLSSLIIITRLTLKIIKTGESLGQTRTLYGWFYQKIFLRCYCIFNLVLKIVARHAYQIGKRRVLETYYSTAKIHVEGLTFYISYNRRCASLTSLCSTLCCHRVENVKNDLCKFDISCYAWVLLMTCFCYV